MPSRGTLTQPPDLRKWKVERPCEYKLLYTGMLEIPGMREGARRWVAVDPLWFVILNSLCALNLLGSRIDPCLTPGLGTLLPPDGS